MAFPRQIPNMVETKTRLTKSQKVRERVEELQQQGLDCDPIKVLMELACGKAQGEDGIYRPITGRFDKHGNPLMLDALIRVQAASELMQYMYPKLKSVEITGNEGNPITFAVVAETAVVGEITAAAESSSTDVNALSPEDEKPLLMGVVAEQPTYQEKDRDFLRPPAAATRPSEMEF